MEEISHKQLLLAHCLGEAQEVQAVSVWQQCVCHGYGEEGWSFWWCMMPIPPRSRQGRAVSRRKPGLKAEESLLLLPGSGEKGVCRFQGQQTVPLSATGSLSWFRDRFRIKRSEISVSSKEDAISNPFCQ